MDLGQVEGDHGGRHAHKGHGKYDQQGKGVSRAVPAEDRAAAAQIDLRQDKAAVPGIFIAQHQRLRARLLRQHGVAVQLGPHLLVARKRRIVIGVEHLVPQRDLQPVDRPRVVRVAPWSASVRLSLYSTRSPPPSSTTVPGTCTAKRRPSSSRYQPAESSRTSSRALSVFCRTIPLRESPTVSKTPSTSRHSQPRLFKRPVFLTSLPSAPNAKPCQGMAGLN